MDQNVESLLGKGLLSISSSLIEDVAEVKLDYTFCSGETVHGSLVGIVFSLWHFVAVLQFRQSTKLSKLIFHDELLTTNQTGLIPMPMQSCRIL